MSPWGWEAGLAVEGGRESKGMTMAWRAKGTEQQGQSTVTLQSLTSRLGIQAAA